MPYGYPQFRQPTPMAGPQHQVPGLQMLSPDDPRVRNFLTTGAPSGQQPLSGWEKWGPLALSAVGMAASAYGDYKDRQQRRKEFEAEQARRDEQDQRSKNLDPVRQMVLQRLLGGTAPAPTGPAPQPAPPPEMAQPPAAPSPMGVYANAVQSEGEDEQRRRMLMARMGLGGGYG